MRTLVIVSCGDSKLASPAPAKDLYTSTLFKLARRYAELAGNAWLIMSSKHGLVEPDTVLEPYDYTIIGKGKDVKQTFQFCIQADWSHYIRQYPECLLKPETPENPGRYQKIGNIVVQALVGEEYADILRKTGMRDVVTFPLAGLQIGERQRWLKQEALRLSGEQDGTLVRSAG